MRVLAFPGCYGSEVFGVADVLAVANQVALALGRADTPPFDVAVVSPRRSVRAVGGTAIGVRPMPADADVLVVPGFELVPDQDLDDRLSTLRQEVDVVAHRAGSGTPVASVCVGAFLLGEAGLLDDRRATTSWLFARALADRHPRALVDPRALVVRDGPVTTTAAFSAATDLALALVRDRCGHGVARMTSRVTLVPDGRTSQAPYRDDALVTPRGHRFADDVMRWLDDHLDEPYRLAQLAGAFHVSSRTLLRRFGEEAGESPLAYLQRARVARAKELLETTDLRLGEVTSAVGYLDPGTFRRLFVECVGVSPADYRRQFRRPVLPSERIG